MRLRRFPIALTLILTVISASTVIAQDKKVALVIGNSAYRKVQTLSNPVNDAKDVAASLKRIGFTVLEQTDLDRKAMRGLIEDFNKAIQGADIALFYYSGHGVQFDNENYLVPVDAEVTVKDDVPDECITLSRITGRMMEAGAKTNVIFLDACRDNPFKAVSRGIDRGLTVVQQRPPESIIVYATAENMKAEDGSGKNGTFTAALLKNIERPESLTDILLDVKAEVRRETNGQQQPAEYDNMTQHVYLAGERAATTPASTPPPVAVPTLSVTRVYGSLSVTTLTDGTLYVDGQDIGAIQAGENAKVDSVEIGRRSLQLRYADGQVESRDTNVKEGRASSVSFTYKKTAPTYKIGDTGPAGGIVFFDKGRYSDGWRYLEAAPTDQSDGIRWYNGSYINVRTGTDIGTGKANTDAIIAAQGEGDYAANLRSNLVINGYSDWFLPSRGECEAMLQNMEKAGRGGLSNNAYWSSTQYDDNHNFMGAFGYMFSENRDFIGNKDGPFSVRMCRAF
jgi:uncharacterized caspase-like protein